VQTSTQALLGAGAVVIAIGAAIYFRPLPEGPRAEGDDLPIEQVEVSVTAPSAVPELEAAPSSDEQTSTADTPVVSPQPSLTGFRFETDGAVLVSGVTQAETVLEIRVDGEAIEQLQADPDGAFLYVGFLGFSDQPRVLSVVADPEGDAIEGDRTFVMAANPQPVQQDPQPSEEEPVVAATEESSDEVTEGEVAREDVETDVDVEEDRRVAAAEQNSEEVVEQDTEQGSVDTPVVNSAPAPTPVSPTILAVTEDGVDVVQAPISDRSPEVMSSVALDAITYDPEGDVVLQGRALGEGFVQVYVNNTPISRLSVEPDGSWRGDLPDVDKGVYTLRIDEVDEVGDVISRIETPFLREDPETVAEALAQEVNDPSFSVATRTVQPGATLWAIAQDRYGDGVAYVTVFDANRDRIRDPDLIYPGQVFVLPEDAQ